VKIIGHRGAKGLAPENTVISLLKAIEHRVDEVEFDLRLTKDGVLILQHDPDLADRSGNRLKVRGHTLKELRAHKADLATFEEAVSAVAKHRPMQVEVKTGVDPLPVVKAVQKLLKGGWQDRDIILSSKSFPILRTLHRELPQVGIAVIEPWSGVRGTWRARRLGTKRLHMNQLWLWSGFLSSLKYDGWQLYAYTVNDPAKARRWAKYGLTGVFTDFPDRFER
jgi:glycerophosphoryl diester phosphodiesterase